MTIRNFLESNKHCPHVGQVLDSPIPQNTANQVWNCQVKILLSFLLHV